jgi:hypothetical protein
MPETKCGFISSETASGRDLLVTHGPTLLVDIGFDPNYDAATSTTFPVLAETKLWALVDTGATESCIDNDLANKLGLPVVDRRHIGGVSGLKEVNMYMAHIHRMPAREAVAFRRQRDSAARAAGLTRCDRIERFL